MSKLACKMIGSGSCYIHPVLWPQSRRPDQQSNINRKCWSLNAVHHFAGLSIRDVSHDLAQSSACSQWWKALSLGMKKDAALTSAHKAWAWKIVVCWIAWASTRRVTEIESNEIEMENCTNDVICVELSSLIMNVAYCVPSHWGDCKWQSFMPTLFEMIGARGFKDDKFTNHLSTFSRNNIENTMC